MHAFVRYSVYQPNLITKLPVLLAITASCALAYKITTTGQWASPLQPTKTEAQLFRGLLKNQALDTSRSGAARAAIEARLSSDPALQAKIKLWQENFVAVDLAAGRQAPPAGLFDPILEAIDAGAGEELPGTQTRRAGTGVWTEMSPGEDPVAKRRSILVRALPGSNYGWHFHDEGHEECLVLEGDLIMGDLKLLPGDYHIAAKGSTHSAATTMSGCLLYQYQSIAF